MSLKRLVVLGLPLFAAAWLALFVAAGGIAVYALARRP